MSDISVTYQTEDDIMHKVTYCVQLDHHPCFFSKQHCKILIILLVGNVYEKLIGVPEFEQKNYINKEMKQIRLKQELN